MLDVHTKAGTSPDQVVRLRHEAEVLAAARHPGVVELLDDRTTDPLSPALVTAWAGASSLAEAPAPTVEEAAGVVAALADTVAALHDMGVVHGRIEPSHVVLSDTGMPVLCGFAGGGYVATLAPDGSLLAESDDVYDLGVLLRSLVVDQGGAEPIPDRRWRLGGQRRWTGYSQRGLLTIADRATDDDPDRRPSAAVLAEQIRDAVPDAHLPTSGREGDPFARLRRVADDPSNSSRSRRVTLLVGALGLALLLVGVSSLRGTSGAAPAAAPRTSTTTSNSNSNSTTTLATLPSATLVATGPPPTVVVGAASYAIGQPGDVVAVGDWDCDGQPTPALLRPADGEVFRFTELATTGNDITVQPTATVPGAVGLRADARSDGCAVLVALLDDGSTVEVPA